MEANSHSKEKEGRKIHSYLPYIISQNSHINYELKSPDYKYHLFWKQGLTKGKTLTSLILF